MSLPRQLRGTNGCRRSLVTYKALRVISSPFLPQYRYSVGDSWSLKLTFLIRSTRAVSGQMASGIAGLNKLMFSVSDGVLKL